MTTVSNEKSETVPSSDFQDNPAERETADPGAESRNSEITLRDRIRVWLEAGKDYWALPCWVREAPVTLTELTVYAREGSWTRRLTGPIRALGIGWLYVVAIPQTGKAYLRAHLMQRPGRFVAALLIWTVVIRSVPGAWVAAHLIRPYFHALAWIFLP